MIETTVTHAEPGGAPARFEPDPRSIAAARRHVRQQLLDWGAEALLDDALLLVSELATNAVVHAGTAFEVCCVHLGNAIRLEVRDGYPARGLPAALPAPDPGQPTGRGLPLCAALSAAWGVEYAPVAKTVWCRLDLPGAELGQPQPAEPVSGPVLVGVLTTDPDGTVRDWNADAEALLGWPAAEVRGRPIGTLVADQPAVRPQPVTGGLTAGTRWSGELWLTHRNGLPVPLYVTRLPHTGSPTEGRGGGSSGPSGSGGGHGGPGGSSGLGAGPAAGGSRRAAAWLLVPAGQRAMLAGTTPAAPATAADLDWATFSDADLVRLRLDELLQRAVDRACDALEGDAAYLLLAGGEGVEARLATSGLPASRPEGRPAMLADQLAVGALPAVHDELGEGAGLPVLAGTGMRSAVVAHLLAEGRSIGQLGVASARPSGFDQAAAERLQRGADRLALSIEARRVAESTRRHRDWLGYLAEASDLLGGTLEPAMTVAMFAQLVVPRLASWCAIRLYDERGEPGLAYAWHADETRMGPVRELLAAVPGELVGALGRSGLLSLLTGGSAAVPAELKHDTAVALALNARGRRLGIAVLGRAAGEPYEQDAVGLAEELVRRAAQALDNARLYRLHQATSQALQRSLLPADLPEVPGLDIGVAYQAAGEGLEVGGDFYDLFAVGEDRWRFAVGDVAGNGPEAAGVTGLARHALRLLGRQLCPPADAVAQLNEAILDHRGGMRFLTVLHGEITPRPAGGMRAELVVAGHPLPYLLRPDGGVDAVGTSQPLLGVLGQVPYRTDTVLLAPGESLLCLTDGVVERRRGSRVLGEQDLPELLARCAGMSARAIAAAVQRAVLDYAPQPPRDDMAVLVLRIPDDEPR